MDEHSVEHLRTSNPGASPRAQSAEVDLIQPTAALEYNSRTVFPSRKGIELEYPARLVGPSNWAGHIPFAFWLVDALRPQTIVELGVHTGNSYFAFLQAVQALALQTRCFGIDHWRGDEHSGFYDEEVYNELKASHDRSYGAFSTLLRCSFVEALPYFSEGSIDLLHLDGFHSYEAVSNDFMSWLPKMSSRGAILLHDTNVRERGFGIWRFWEELAERYPTFEFHHSYGLGIAFVGSERPPSSIAGLTAVKTGNDINMVRTYFSRLGSSVLDRYCIGELEKNIAELKAQRETSTANMAAEISERDQRLLDLTERLHQTHAQADTNSRRLTDDIVSRDKQLVAADSELRRLIELVAQRDHQLATADSELRRLTELVAQRDHQLATADSELRRLIELVAQRDHQLATADSELRRLTELVAQRDHQLATADSELRRLTELVAQRDHQLATADSELRRLIELVAQRDHQLATADSELRRLTELVAQRDQRLKDINENLHNETLLVESLKEQVSLIQEESASQLEQTTKRILNLETEVGAKAVRIDFMESQGVIQVRVLRQQTTTIARLQRETATQREHLKTAQQLLGQSQRDAMELVAERTTLIEQLKQHVNSRSWRMTAPIRSTTTVLRRLKRTLIPYR